MSTSISNEAWGKPTHPSKHDPAQFRYLVHAINPGARIAMILLHSGDLKSGFTVAPKCEGDQSVDLLAAPERLAERVYLSMSLVDQDHIGTWGDAGLIVEAPVDNVIMASNTDLGTHNAIPELLERAAGSRQRRHSGLDPVLLLRDSAPNSYNEVVARAKSTSGQLRLVGFFVKVDDEGHPLAEFLAEKIRMLARRLDLPTVNISEPSLYREERVEVKDKFIAVQTDNARFIFPTEQAADDPRAPKGFMAYRQRSSRWMTLEEAQHAMQVIECIRPDLDTSAVLASYREADKRRQEVIVRHGEDGTVTEVRQRTGYGSAETDHVIEARGFASIINLQQKSKEHTKSLMSGSLGAITDSDAKAFRSMSPEEARTLIAAAKVGADQQLVSALDVFWQKVEPSINNRWGNELQRRQRLPEGDSLQHLHQRIMSIFGHSSLSL